MEAQLSIRIPEDLKAALDRASKKAGVKNAEIVRRALQEYLAATMSSRARPAERVRGLLGSIESGVPDLAERHRDYLLESLRRGQ
jgi:metal-responsive CopG/Arc/MetJ family transcriptional regulator